MITGAQWVQIDSKQTLGVGFFNQFVAFLNQGFKKKTPKPNTFHLIKICNENRSLHTQQEKGGLVFFSPECVAEPGNPSAKTSWALTFPTSHCSYQGELQFWGSIYGACSALLCTFSGHRGAERRIFPKECTQAEQTDPAAAGNVSVLPTCLLLPC